MMLRGERIGKAPIGSRLLLYWRLTLSLLRSEIAVGSVTMARIGLIGLACALQTLVLFSPGHFRPSPTWMFAVFVPLGTAASLVCCLVATLPLRRMLGLRTRQTLGMAALVSLVLLSLVGVVQGSNGIRWVSEGQPYNNDGAAMDLYAAQRALDGHNPYLRTNIVAALAAINAPCSTTTPLMDGQFRGTSAYPSEVAVQQVCLERLRLKPRSIPPEFESKYNYPAGSFLFILPFLWAGIHDMRFLYALAILGIGWYIASRLPSSLRPVVPLVLLADVPLLALTAGGQPDPIYGLFLLIGYAEWTNRRVSPIFMGLAIATKQLAWFFLPFYVLLILRRYGWQEACRRCALMGAVFLALNLPFIIQSPRGYVTSISAPMTDPMFPLGIGAIALFVGNLLPLLPKVAFTIAELGAWAGGVALSIRVRALAPAAVAVFAVFPLFFAWRSLVNYFYLVPLLTLAIVLAGGYQGEAEDTRT